MNSQLPIDRVNYGSRPSFSRRHSARYYAHRVKESLTTRVSKFICTIFLFILLVVGLIAFILWLSLRPHRPRFHLEEFTIPALPQPNSPYENVSIHFNLTIRNSNQKVIVHYDSIQSTVYYREQSIGGVALATEAFDQESKNTTVFDRVLTGSSLQLNGQRWMDMQSDLKTGTVSLKLEITSVIRFEIFSWDSKRHKMHATCPAVVGTDGVLMPDYRDKRCGVYFT